MQSGPKVLMEESLGVNYRALNDLFSLQAQRKGTINYDISVQMIEIYNEQVRDLLDDSGNRRYPFLLDCLLCTSTNLNNNICTPWFLLEKLKEASLFFYFDLIYSRGIFYQT